MVEQISPIGVFVAVLIAVRIIELLKKLKK